MRCGVGRRHSSGPVLLWLWCRLAATAPIQSKAWEPPYAASAALKKKKKKRKEKQFIYNVVLVSGVQQSNSIMCVCVYSFSESSPIDYYKILSIVPCAIE